MAPPGRHSQLTRPASRDEILAAFRSTPRIALEAPKEPITINLNIKIEQEVRVKVEKDLDAAFAQDPELFGKQ